MNILRSTKYKNVLKNNKVVIVIDDLKSAEPWDPRGIKVYGTADIVNRQGGTWKEQVISILVTLGLNLIRNGVGESKNLFL